VRTKRIANELGIEVRRTGLSALNRGGERHGGREDRMARERREREFAKVRMCLSTRSGRSSGCGSPDGVIHQDDRTVLENAARSATLSKAILSALEKHLPTAEGEP
jgi:hypothetical protein